MMKEEREVLYKVKLSFKDGSWRTTYKRSYPSKMMQLAGELLSKSIAVEYKRVV